MPPGHSETANGEFLAVSPGKNPDTRGAPRLGSVGKTEGLDGKPLFREHVRWVRMATDGSCMTEQSGTRNEEFGVGFLLHAC